MSGIRDLIREIHQRSLWQVLGIYLGSSWAVLQVVDDLVDTSALPYWVYRLALLFLLLGLPVVLATAFVQEGAPGAEESSLPRTADSSRPETWTGVLRRLFTWRNAALGGLVAFAMWGAVSAGWLLLLPHEQDALPWSRSASTTPRVESREPDSAAGLPADDAPSRDSAVEQRDPAVANDGRDPPRGLEGAGVDPDSPAVRPAREPASPPDRSAEADAGIGAREDYRAYASARSLADAARSSAIEIAGDSLGKEAFRSADSARVAALEAAADGRHAEAALGMERARAGYAEARRDAVTSLQMRADSARRRLAAADSAAADSEPTNQKTDGPTGAASPRATVEDLLDRLADAMAAEDLPAVRSIWVSLTAEQALYFEQFFEDRRDIQVTFDVDWSSLIATRDRISFTIETTWDYVEEERGKRVRQPPFQQRFQARQANGVWTLSSE